MPNSRPIAKKTGSFDSEDDLPGEDVQISTDESLHAETALIIDTRL
jgi:hypothetical protein